MAGEVDLTQSYGPFEFGRELLGPVFVDYLSRLDHTIRYFSEERDAKILFVSRAGVRIHRLYSLYLESIGAKSESDIDYLWTSRLMTLKGTWSTQSDAGCAIISDEFGLAPLRDVVSSLLATSDLSERVNYEAPELQISSTHFKEFIWGSSQAAHYCRWHLADQSDLFSDYIAGLIGERRTILLVDSGWQGTSQTLLADWRNDVEWWGAYFGRSGRSRTDRRYWHQIIGLVFEADEVDGERPETCIVASRHLIEDVLEPRSRSVEHLANARDGIFAPAAEDILAAIPTMQRDALYLGIESYISDLPGVHGPAVRTARAQRAWPQIAKAVLSPTREQVQALGGSTRSADYGRSLTVPLLVPPADRYAGDSAERRVADSLWPAAQVVLEYPPDLVAIRQAQLWRPSPVRAKQNADPVLGGFTLETDTPTVAIITRTMNRNIFLRRAIESVAQQTYSDYVHVIVCDGGDIEAVRDTVEKSGGDKRRLILIDNVVNRGMEAASNIGVNAVRSDYVVIHDDDDTWEPDFLQTTVGFLGSWTGRKYNGVVTNTWHVSEEVCASGIVLQHKKPYGLLINIQIAELAATNQFAPIAFVFRRSAYESVGGFREHLPVLGDWDFNLRVMMKGDIAVLPDRLANYHHRDVGNTSLFANSVTGGIDKHVEYDAVIRNEFFRQALGSEGALPLALMVNFGLTSRRQGEAIARVEVAAGRIQTSRTSESPQTGEKSAWVSFGTSQEEQLSEQLAEALIARQDLEVELQKAYEAANILQQVADDRWAALAAILDGSAEASAPRGSSRLGRLKAFTIGKIS